MTTTNISKTDVINKIIDAMEEFGLDNITDNTTVFVRMTDLSDVEVADTEFNTFTKMHATLANFFIDYDGCDIKIERRQIREWLESLSGVEFE